MAGQEVYTRINRISSANWLEQVDSWFPSYRLCVGKCTLTLCSMIQIRFQINFKMSSYFFYGSNGLHCKICEICNYASWLIKVVSRAWGSYWCYGNNQALKLVRHLNLYEWMPAKGSMQAIEKNCGISAGHNMISKHSNGSTHQFAVYWPSPESACVPSETKTNRYPVPFVYLFC